MDHIDESAYEGNGEIIAAVLRCLGFREGGLMNRRGWTGAYYRVGRRSAHCVEVAGTPEHMFPRLERVRTNAVDDPNDWPVPSPGGLREFTTRAILRFEGHPRGFTRI